MSRRLEDDWEEVIPEDPTIEQLIDEILNNLMEYSYKYGAGEIPTSKNPPLIIAREAKQALLQLLNETQKNGVAWSIGVVDDLHNLVYDNDTTDRMFKGIKNTIRDKHEDVTGIDPAPEYPITAKLNPKENK